MNCGVIIEISKGSNIKYEYDTRTKRLVCDRILHTPMAYPFNYGYIENTLSGDGDPLDAIVLCKDALLPTCYIECKVIGVLHTEDESGIDPKIILVPVAKIDPECAEINDITDVDKSLLKKLEFFFENYKKLENNKWVKINGICGKDKALEIITKSKVKSEYI